MKYVIDGVVTALLILVGVVNLSTGELVLGTGILLLAAAYFAVSFWKARSVEPGATDVASAARAEEWQARGYDGDDDSVRAPVDSFDDLIRYDDEEFRLLEGMSKNEAHRRNMPNCRYCAFVDKKNAEAKGDQVP